LTGEIDLTDRIRQGDSRVAQMDDVGHGCALLAGAAKVMVESTLE
jgi:hypothetical protein